MKLTIGHLYPSTMSTYGDVGNIICLRRRAEWRGIETKVVGLEIGEPVPQGIDLYFFGGGQDMAQGSVAEDLRTRADRLAADAAAGTPILAICGGYQLLGEAYLPANADPIPGIGILPVRTQASDQRMIGDLIIEANPHLGLTGSIVGFENHSGKTRILSTEAQPLGTVRHGYGNNGEDGTEGCVLGATVGCYLHGSLLPKNPLLADWLLEKALRRHDPKYILSPLDDAEELRAHAYMDGRYPR